MRKKTLLITYLVCLHLLLLSFLMERQLSDFFHNNVVEKDTELTDYFHTMVAFQQRIDKNLAPKSALFIGDSLTQGLAVSRITSNAVNYGIGNDTTVGVIDRLPLYQSIESSKFIVLAIGVNDFKYRSIEQIIANFDVILLMLSSARQIIISAILPVDENAQHYIKNNEIKRLNTSLAELSLNFPNADYFDISDKLSLSENLIDHYHVGDGVHLNKAGYDIWINNLKTWLAKNETFNSFESN